MMENPLSEAMPAEVRLAHPPLYPHADATAFPSAAGF